MTDCLIEAGTLTASHADRIVSGLLLPYGEVGNTNLGKFSVAPGTVSIPADVTVLAANTDHARENPVARFMTAVDTPAGVVASFHVGENPEGDSLLAEIADKNNPDARRKLSVELADVVLRAGKLVSGRMFGAGFVKKGAFPSATVMAADVGDEPAPTDPTTTTSKTSEEYTDENGVKHVKTTTTTTKVDGDKTTITEVTVITDPEQDEPKEPPVGNATAPNTLTAGAATATPTGLSLNELGKLMFAAKQGQLDLEELADKLKGHNGATLFAALSDVKYDGAGGLAPTMGQPQWLGEVKNLTVYQQQVLTLFGHADLTSLTMNGFQWGIKPQGGDWAGNKANVPSNTLTVTPVTATASRYAIGHDIAREFIDFPAAGFFESYAAAVTEDYLKWADAKVAAAILAAAIPVAGDALTTLPGPTGGTIGSAASAIIDGAVAVATTGTLPTFALLAPALYKAFIKNPTTNVIGYLNAALGLTDGSLEGFIVRPSITVPAGKVLVGARGAATVYELPGVPIRIDALDLARGGIDKAAFGYAAVNINDAKGLQLVTAATA